MNAHLREHFQAVILPAVRSHTCVVFRNHNQESREEAVQEAISSAWQSYVSLVERGQEAVAHPTTMARFAVKHVLNGRHVGGSMTSTDVLSSLAQRKHGFKTRSLPAGSRPMGQLRERQMNIDSFDERLQDNTLTPVPDQVAFRHDFPQWLSRLDQVKERIARLLMIDLGTTEVAEKTKLSCGRISQVRRELHENWEAFHAI